MKLFLSFHILLPFFFGTNLGYQTNRRQISRNLFEEKHFNWCDSYTLWPRGFSSICTLHHLLSGFHLAKLQRHRFRNRQGKLVSENSEYSFNLIEFFFHIPFRVLIELIITFNLVKSFTTKVNYWNLI